MDDAQRNRAREIQGAIRAILYHEWDPIGVRGAAPEDEYDSYIGGVYRILTSSRSEDELVAYLAKAETEDMGLGRSPRQQLWHEELKRVAQKLLALKVKG
jgi:hypothetical protein